MGGKVRPCRTHTPPYRSGQFLAAQLPEVPQKALASTSSAEGTGERLILPRMGTGLGALAMCQPPGHLYPGGPSRAHCRQSYSAWPLLSPTPCIFFLHRQDQHPCAGPLHRQAPGHETHSRQRPGDQGQDPHRGRPLLRGYWACGRQLGEAGEVPGTEPGWT